MGIIQKPLMSVLHLPQEKEKRKGGGQIILYKGSIYLTQRRRHAEGKQKTEGSMQEKVKLLKARRSKRKGQRSEVRIQKAAVLEERYA